MCPKYSARYGIFLTGSLCRTLSVIVPFTRESWPSAEQKRGSSSGERAHDMTSVEKKIY
jgi:hypothetical protein